MNALLGAASDEALTPPDVRSNVTIDTPLTRVSLAFVEGRINVYLRFGQPVRAQRLNRWRRYVLFAPSALFCRIRWEANDYGTTRWQLLVLQSGAPLDAVERIGGILPGVCLLLRAEGERQVQLVLQRIDGIEALGIDPSTTSLAYWYTLGNRLSAHLLLPAYTVERHAAYRASVVLR